MPRSTNRKMAFVISHNLGSYGQRVQPANRFGKFSIYSESEGQAEEGREHVRHFQAFAPWAKIWMTQLADWLIVSLNSQAT